MKRFDITIVEVLVHRASIELWDEDGPEAFSTETLGRTDLIVCDEAPANAEVQS